LEIIIRKSIIAQEALRILRGLEIGDRYK